MSKSGKPILLAGSRKVASDFTGKHGHKVFNGYDARSLLSSIYPFDIQTGFTLINLYQIPDSFIESELRMGSGV